MEESGEVANMNLSRENSVKSHFILWQCNCSYHEKSSAVRLLTLSYYIILNTLGMYKTVF